MEGFKGLLSKATQLARDVTDSVKESANRHTAVVSRAPASRWASYSVQTPRLLDLRALYSCERCAETGASHFKLPACAELTGAGLRKCLPAWLCTHHPYLIRCKVSVERIECWVDCDEKDVLPVLDGRLVVKLVPVPYDIGLKSCVGVGWETEWTSMSHLFMPQTGHLSPPPVQLAPTPQVAPQETAPPVEHVSADERARLAVGDHQQRRNREHRRLQEKLGASNELTGLVQQWARGPGGEVKDIRVLLSTVQDVMWDGAGWEAISFGQLVASRAVVKKAYFKAIRECHPDRSEKGDGRQRFLAQSVFHELNSSWAKFQTELSE